MTALSPESVLYSLVGKNVPCTCSNVNLTFICVVVPSSSGCFSMVALSIWLFCMGNSGLYCIEESVPFLVWINMSACRDEFKSLPLERYNYSSLETATKLGNKYLVTKITNEKRQLVAQKCVFMYLLKHLRDASSVSLFAFKSKFQLESLAFALILSPPLTQSRRAWWGHSPMVTHQQVYPDQDNSSWLSNCPNPNTCLKQGSMHVTHISLYDSGLWFIGTW